MKIFNQTLNMNDLIITIFILAIGFVIMCLVFAEWYKNGKTLMDWSQEYLSYILCVGYGVIVGWFAKKGGSK